MIYSEAGTQCKEGQYAVGYVVRNRVRSNSYPDTYEGVIFQDAQFSSTESTNFNEVIEDKYYDIARDIYYGGTKNSIPENVYHFKTLECDADWDLTTYDIIEDHIFYYE